MIIANPIYDVVFNRLMEKDKVADILHHVGTDPQERKQIEIEQEAWRTVNAMFGEKERKYRQQLDEQQKALDDKDKLIAELLRKIDQQK